jgi:RND family efflux transporter MFP subunit
MITQLKPMAWIGIVLVIFIGSAGVWLPAKSRAQNAGPSSEGKTLYTCGMHPQVVQDHPGNCPICGMKLTPIHREAGQSQVIAIDPVTTQKMGIRTAILRRGPLRRTIRTVGVIEYDETTLADVTTKFKGWIEKLYINATGQLVMRGDPLLEIYSPDLYSAQVEYLLATDPANKSGAGDDLLKVSARTKLKFFDISDEQIAALDRTRRPQKALRIMAPQDGFVIEKSAVVGQMVDTGARIYRLGDLGLVWVQAQIYEQDLACIKLGQEATVTLDYQPDREYRGRVTYIYPSVDEKTRTARVRMEFHNPGYFLKPGMFATVRITAELAPSALLAPDMAVLRSGEKTTVFVALEGGKFEPRTVALGAQGENDTYQVLGGLKEGERVVTSGQFMLDSESQLREAIQKMLPAKPAGQAAAGAPAEVSGTPANQETAASSAPPASAAVKYVCPMPEHVSIQYDHPGQCPICGMTLVPVSTAALEKLQPGGKVLYYTCPMPEHSDVHEAKPGKCPKCGMTLIPVMEPPPLPGPAMPPVLYTCPMEAHADVVSDKPGQCPKCGMDLVPTGTVPHGKIAEENWRKQHQP